MAAIEQDWRTIQGARDRGAPRRGEREPDEGPWRGDQRRRSRLDVSGVVVEAAVRGLDLPVDGREAPIDRRHRGSQIRPRIRSREMLRKLASIEGKLDRGCRGHGWDAGRPSQVRRREHNSRLSWRKAQGRSGEFERFGIENQDSSRSIANGRPVEATSFPSFIHEELAFETWPDSDLWAASTESSSCRSNGRRAGPSRGVVRRAFFWSPTESELEASDRVGAIREVLSSRTRPPSYRKRLRRSTSTSGQGT